MKEILKIETERVDDIPLLLAHMQRMKIASLLDQHIPVHGNRKGLSVGDVVIIWLAHILSEGDHRMKHVQEWSERRLETIRRSGLSSFNSSDMTDDRLADVLRMLSSDIHWVAFEQDLMGHLVLVYNMQKKCVRVDTTTAKSYAEVNEEGLLQLGHSKDHRPDLGQLKIALASLDPLGLPLATEVLSGESADDPVYEPIIARVRDGLKETGLLYVGDCKMAAISTRASIDYHGDYYLCPLSAVQVPHDKLREEVDKLKEQGAELIKVERLNDKGERICIVQGYEISLNLAAEVNGHMKIWTERRFLVQSTSGAEAAKHALLERLEKAQKAIHDIFVRKQGKQRATNRIEIDQAIKQIEEKFRVEGLLITNIYEEMHEKYVRAYKGKPPEVRQEVSYTIKSERNEEALAYTISHLSWRAYATNQKTDILSLEQDVEAYRDEYRVERCFERLKGHPLSLAPMYVQRDDHRVGLVRLLTIALRVLTLLEGVIRKSLQEQKQELAGLYAGNPKRRTAQPTAEHLLKAFDEVTLTIVSTASFV